MLTSYASCWASFMLRGMCLTLFGIALLSSTEVPTAAALAMVLVAGGANAISIGFRLRALSGLYGLLLLEGGLSAFLGVFSLIRPDSPILAPALCIAVLAAANGALQFSLAKRYRNAQHRAWPVAAVAGSWIGFSLLLAWQPLAASTEAWAAVGALSLALGAVLLGVSLHLRAARRLARHELLRDAPLAPRTTMRAAVSARPMALRQTAGRRSHAAHHAA